MSRGMILGLLLLGTLAVPAGAQDEVVAWHVLRNSLVELQLDRDGDGVADRTELHVVARWGRTVLTDAELDAQAVQDHVWLFIVEEDDGRVIYWVQPEVLMDGDAPCTRRDEPCWHF